MTIDALGMDLDTDEEPGQKIQKIKKGSTLALLGPIDPAKVFVKDGTKPLLAAIKEKADAASEGLDISTKAGRAAIKSLAADIAHTKTFVDDAGKNYKASKMGEIKAIDEERSVAWDFIQALQDEKRKPLTDWENKDKARIARHESAITAMGEMSVFLSDPTSMAVASRLMELKDRYGSVDFEEFSQRAGKVYSNVEFWLLRKLDDVRKDEADRAELARLRKEAAEREQKDREDRIAREAAEAAQKAAEAKSAREREEAERKAAAEIAARQRAQDLAEAEKRDSELRAKRAEEALKAAERQAELQRQAQERMKRDAEAAAKRREEAAIERERQRAADEEKARLAAEAKRRANDEHRAQVDSEASEAIFEILDRIGEADSQMVLAQRIVEAIVAGKIPHVRINY